MFKRFALVNPDGTMHNLVYLENVDAVLSNEDWKDLAYFDYTEWAPEDHPRMHWTYNFETQAWNKNDIVLPTPLPAEPLVPIEEPAADDLAGGN